MKPKDEPPEITVRSVPALDTGIGREAGYRNDAELMAAAETQRAALDPDVRALVDEVDRAMTRAFLFGEGI